MKDFNDLQALWQNQNTTPSDSAEKLIGLARDQKTKSIRKHRSGIIVLSITSLILILIWAFTPFSNPVGYGLTIMISALIIRVLLETYSYKRMKNIDIAEVSSEYQQQIKAYFKLRKQLMTTVTAITVILYIVGFVIMLPTFKQTLPTWFFWYIVGFLMIGIPIGSYFLIRQARNEIKDLKRVIEKL